MNNQNFKSIVLIGMPASGKTSCAKLLSQKLSAVYCDSDELIETAAKSSINDLFINKGEPYFRSLEKLFVGRLAQIKDNKIGQSKLDLEKDSTTNSLTTEVERVLLLLDKADNSTLIVSTGGGLAIEADNLTTLKNIGLVVYLYTEPEILVDRLIDDNSRPLIATSSTNSSKSTSLEPIKEKVNRLNRITSLLSERDSLYKMAHCTIDTSFQSQDKVVNSIIHKFNKWKSNEDFQ